MSADNAIMVAEFTNGFWVADVGMSSWSEMQESLDGDANWYTEDQCKAILWGTFANKPSYATEDIALIAAMDLYKISSIVEYGICHAKFDFPLQEMPGVKLPYEEDEDYIFAQEQGPKILEDLIAAESAFICIPVAKIRDALPAFVDAIDDVGDVDGAMDEFCAALREGREADYT